MRNAATSLSPPSEKRVRIHGWPGLGPVELVPCSCETCAVGRTVAIDRYPGLQYPAVFPRMGARPQHFQASQVIDATAVGAVERHAEALQTGVEP